MPRSCDFLLVGSLPSLRGAPSPGRDGESRGEGESPPELVRCLTSAVSVLNQRNVLLWCQHLLAAGARLPSGSTLSSRSSYGEVTFSLDSLQYAVRIVEMIYHPETSGLIGFTEF